MALTFTLPSARIWLRRSATCAAGRAAVELHAEFLGLAHRQLVFIRAWRRWHRIRSQRLLSARQTGHLPAHLLAAVGGGAGFCQRFRFLLLAGKPLFGGFADGLLLLGDGGLAVGLGLADGRDLGAAGFAAGSKGGKAFFQCSAAAAESLARCSSAAIWL